jgi:pimeloyl-ACP methyl ester carboxylesterase
MPKILPGLYRGMSMGTVAPVIVLIHSPNLGPGSWRPVADELSRAGHQVVVPSLAGFADGGPPYVPRLVRLAAGQMPGGQVGEVILVTHSGAGVFVPHLVRAVAAREATAVFADAALPRQSGPSTVVEGEFLPFLRELASGGVVPPWPQWWPGEDLSPLFPDEATREAVTSEAGALPLRYFEETLPALPEGWPPCRAAYLAFSESYRREAAQAARAGWPVRELPGEHLHMLVSPGEVAAAITSLAAEARAADAFLRSLP